MMEVYGSVCIHDDKYKDIRYYYDGNDNLQYLCKNVVHKAATSSVTWEITKYTWSETNKPTRTEGPLMGSVDNRASLDWA